MENIKKITVENYKGVAGTVTLEPEGRSLIEIAGPNGAGKSSFIDAVLELFDPAGTRKTPNPLHDPSLAVTHDSNGEKAKRAISRVETDHYTIERVWKKDNSPGELKVTAIDGTKGGKDLLNRLTGGRMLDPSKFIALSAEEKKAEVLRFLPFDITEFERREAAAKEERTIANRAAKESRIRLEATENPGVVGETSASEILARIEKADALRAAAEKATSAAAQWVQYHKSFGDQIDALKQQIAELENQRTEAEPQVQAAFNAAKEAQDAAEHAEDADALRQSLATIEQRNEQARKTTRYLEIQRDTETHEKKAQECEEAVQAIRTEREKALEEAKLPARGLSFEDGDLLLDGTPLSQKNSAALEVLAMELATGIDSEIRLVVMKHADLLDDVSIARVRELAAERRFLVLAERDRDRSGAEIVFRDGQVEA